MFLSAWGWRVDWHSWVNWRSRDVNGKTLWMEPRDIWPSAYVTVPCTSQSANLPLIKSPLRFAPSRPFYLPLTRRLAEGLSLSLADSCSCCIVQPTDLLWICPSVFALYQKLAPNRAALLLLLRHFIGQHLIVRQLNGDSLPGDILTQVRNESSLIKSLSEKKLIKHRFCLVVRRPTWSCRHCSVQWRGSVASRHSCGRGISACVKASVTHCNL